MGSVVESAQIEITPSASRRRSPSRIEQYETLQREAAAAILERPDYYDPDSALFQWARKKLEMSMK